MCGCFMIHIGVGNDVIDVGIVAVVLVAELRFWARHINRGDAARFSAGYKIV